VELPIIAATADHVAMHISVGGAVAFETSDYYMPGDPLFVNLARFGQIGTVRVWVQGSCFELEVKTIKTL